MRQRKEEICMAKAAKKAQATIEAQLTSAPVLLTPIELAGSSNIHGVSSTL